MVMARPRMLLRIMSEYMVLSQPGSVWMSVAPVTSKECADA